MGKQTPEERARVVGCMLAEKFPQVDGFLHHSNPYEALVATVLSAQCTDRQVNKVTPRLFALASSPEEMILLSQEKLEQLIHSTGFFRQKARAILAFSQILIDRYGGHVPDNFDDLESLPGVGHKTASVVLMQCFGQTTFPVDTHIFRLARRWKLSSGKTPTAVEKDLKRLFPKERWGALHLQFISYGRLYCGARSCDGHRCEICRALS